MNNTSPFGKINEQLIKDTLVTEKIEMSRMDVQDADSERQEPGCEYEDFKDQAVNHLNNQ